MRMRLTFHIGKYTVTIIVRETSKKAKTQHDKKSAATLHKGQQVLWLCHIIKANL